MIGIGIDTGGTCTDVVVYDRRRDEIRFSAKAQTTRHDLKLGICGALRQIPQELRKRADYVALSTTMATSACVENEGGRAGLVLIGAHPKVVAQNGASYGLPPIDRLCLLPGRLGHPLSVDEAALRKELTDKFADCGSMAVIERRNQAEQYQSIGQYLQQYKLEDTARQVGFSANYFSKIFKDEMGCTFNYYLSKLRVDLLLVSRLSIREICDAVGYEEQSYFIKVFTRFPGVTPGKFRKRGGRLDSSKERDTTVP